jgi:hypothetical protein
VPRPETTCPGSTRRAKPDALDCRCRKNWLDLAVITLRALVIWVLIAAAEVAQGALRVRFLNRRVGDRRARQIGVFTGSLLILAIAWVGVPWVGPRTAPECFGVGGLWLGLMLAFDFYFGRVVFRASWERIAADFDPRRGGLLGFGMAILFLAPWLIVTVRGFR